MAQQIRRDIFGRQDTRTPSQRAAYRWTPEEAAEIARIDADTEIMMERKFWARWTAEKTAAVRAQWNEMARQGADRRELEEAFDVDAIDLKRAIERYA